MDTALEQNNRFKRGCICSYVFQPIISLETGLTHHVEMLTRLNLDSSMSVEEYLCDAEEKGTILCYDFSNLLRAAYLLSCVRDIENHPALSVNISASSISDPWLEVILLPRLQELLSVPGTLIIEITETYPVSARQELKRFSDRVRCAGHLLAIDDFGSGHHCLEDIVLIQPDIVKIDGQWIRNPGLCLGGDDNNLFDTLHMLHDMEIALVAEHISDAMMYETAVSLGFDLMQGNYLSRPRDYPF